MQWPHNGLNLPSHLRFMYEELGNERNEDFESVMVKAVEKRVIGDGEIGILFSGGLDSTIIAALLAQILPEKASIYLLNLAFISDAPDRLTALISYQELRTSHPNRDFKLVLIDVTQEEINDCRDHIMNLLATNDTRMDFSIGTSLYFASKGEGKLYETNENLKFPGKILFSGSGADEILGGYSRYRSNFLQYNKDGVIREMSLDLNRIWHRNLGRDDRVTATHGRELRFPFLDTYL